MHIRTLSRLFVVAGMLLPLALQAAETASATITETTVAPGENQYSLTLNDTGTTTVGTFWFAWVPGDNFMPATPTGITSPEGWTEMVTTGGASGGSAIQWTATTAGNDLAAGVSLSGFTFDSGLTLTQLEAPSTGHPSDPVDTAFIYSGAPFSDSGFQVTPTVGTQAAAPEPGEMGLAALGLGVMTLVVWRKRTAAC